jgi:hypothetical protein
MKRKVRVTVGKRLVALTPEQAARVNLRVSDALRFEKEIRRLITQRWLPKYLRRTGLPIYWAWGHELSVAETMALLCQLTGSAEAVLRTMTGSADYGELLDVLDRLENDQSMPVRAKRRQVVVVIALLLALSYSCKAIGYHSLSIRELVTRGLDGDDLALRQAVAVDPSVLTMPSVVSYMGELQLCDERRRLAAIYRAAMKGPNKQLQPNWQPRYMERVLAEGRLFESFSREEIFTLVTERLKLYDTRGGDPFKGLFTLFSRWRGSATT